MTKTDAAPHTCPGTLTFDDGSKELCGEPCYIGFGVPPKCTHKLCSNYDAQTWVDHIMSLPDTGDPPPIEPSTDTMVDFCSHCHTPVTFKRCMDQSGDYVAYCPNCGKPNFWASAGMELDDTAPWFGHLS